MDKPKVKTKFYGEIVTDQEQSMFHKLIDFGSCNLHILHGNLKTGAEKSGWKLKKILKGAFQTFITLMLREKTMFLSLD